MSNRKISEIAFLTCEDGKHLPRDTGCVSNPSSVFLNPRGTPTKEHPQRWKKRIHCLYHGEKFHLKHKCYSCNYFISFVQRVA